MHLGIQIGVPYGAIAVGPAFDWNLLRDGMTPKRGSVTFTRASTATYIHPTTGFITSAAINAARIESDGLLIEPQRTNLWIRSQEFENASWNKTYMTSSAANAVTGPDGIASAELISEKSATASQWIYSNTACAVGAGASVSMSVYAKAGTRQWLQFFVSLSEASGNPRANFDILNGALGAYDAGFAPTAIGAAASGWFRCCAKFTAVPSIVNPILSMARSSSEARAPSYAGSTSNNLSLYGAQIEVGGYSTSYIPTTATAATRSADVCTLTIPAGVSSIQITYGDNTTATVSVTPGGTYVLPASQKKYKSIVAL